MYPKPMPKPSMESSQVTDENEASGTSEEASFTIEQVSQHKGKDSCWMAIEGNVYDLTPFVQSGLHPGRDAILEGCGIDATELFNSRPTGSKTPHSTSARKMMAKYLIGTLKSQ